MTIDSINQKMKVVAGALVFPDQTPDSIAGQFTDETSVPASTTRTSNAITITGVDSFADVPITVSGDGGYRLNGAASTTSPGTGVLDDQIQLEHTSNATAGQDADTTLTLDGTVSDTFTSTTINLSGSAYWESNTHLVLGDCLGQVECRTTPTDYTDSGASVELRVDAGSGNSYDASRGFTGAQAASGVSASAANPDGDATAGLRQWYNDPKDWGTDPQRIWFNPPIQNLWFRWYMRYEAGTDPGSLNSHKLLYMHFTRLNNTPWIIPQPYQDQFRIGIGGITNVDTIYSTDGGVYTWQKAFGGSVSDGLFHYCEMQVKTDTGISDGELRFWIEQNGVPTLVVEGTNLDLSNGGTDSTILGGIDEIDFIENHNQFFSGGVKYIDLSDIVVYNTTPPNTDSSGNSYIGPL